jgi:hypothetical protein
MTAVASVATHAGRMKRAIAPVLALALLLCTAPAVRAADVDDIAAPYLQRTDSIAAGAGNAKAVNSVTHMLDPWPPYAGNRRIPGNGQRMSGAVERYRDVSKQSQMPATLAPASAAQAGSSGSTTVPPSTGQ